MEKLILDVHDNQPLFRGLMEFLSDKAAEEVSARLGEQVHVDVRKLMLDLEGRLVIQYLSWPKAYAI
jgi:hypothetical protein